METHGKIQFYRGAFSNKPKNVHHYSDGSTTEAEIMGTFHQAGVTAAKMHETESKDWTRIVITIWKPKQR